jgi:hypothetical protein
VERRRIAYPKAQDYADFQKGLQQRFAIGEMVFNDQFARQKTSTAYAAEVRVARDRIFRPKIID